MTPGQVPPGPLLVDTDVVSWLALRENRYAEFAELVRGHQLLVCYVTLAEVRTFLALGVLAAERSTALESGLADYSVLPTNIDHVVAEWVGLRAATTRLGSPDDRERRQNDTWIAACAASISPPLPVVTANLGDFTPLARAGQFALVHPDL